METVACYSNKGGVGKTALAVNLAYAFSCAGQRVLLCDLDPQGASSYYFRVKPSRKLTKRRLFGGGSRFGKFIRASDFDNLDILPANSGFRNLDAFLSRNKGRTLRLGKALKSVSNEYDLVLLDCPPGISALSENVFTAADLVVVPVVPTVLSERAFGQLLSFLAERGVAECKLVALFSMVEARKSLHTETMRRMRAIHGKVFLDAMVPFSTDVERMGIREHRAPVASYAASRPVARLYQAAHSEIKARLARRTSKAKVVGRFFGRKAHG